jgi:hypothetical protein
MKICTNLLDLTKADSILKLKSFWFKGWKVVIVFKEKVPKSAISHINVLMKAAEVDTL